MRKKTFFILMYSVILVAFTELSLRVFLSSTAFNAWDIIGKVQCDASWRWYWMQRHKSTSAFLEFECGVYDATKGWSIKPNLINMSFADKLLNSNSKGIRGNKEYEYGKSANKRILIFGDSFTFGEETSDSENYPYYLQQMLPSFEIINFGVLGYGHDQMLIYFKEEGVKYKPDIVILGFMNENMLRNTLTFRDYSKPKFELANGKLKLKNFPVPKPKEFIKNEPYRLKIIDLFSILYQKYRFMTGTQQKEMEEITTAIISEMVKEIRRIGAIPVLVYLPTGHEMDNPNIMGPGEPFLANYCINHGVYYLSLRPRFLEKARNFIKLKTFGHYGQKEHQIISEAIKEYLDEKILLQKPNNLLSVGKDISRHSSVI
jgi:hypothetical protein